MEPSLRMRKQYSWTDDIRNELTSSTPIEKEKLSKNAFPHVPLLLAFYTLPFLILLSFGGKLSMICLGFGLISAYIFDLLGSIEVVLSGILSFIILTGF
jgi:hypothetical protein